MSLQPLSAALTSITAVFCAWVITEAQSRCQPCLPGNIAGTCFTQQSADAMILVTANA